VAVNTHLKAALGEGHQIIVPPPFKGEVRRGMGFSWQYAVIIESTPSPPQPYP